MRFDRLNNRDSVLPSPEIIAEWARTIADGVRILVTQKKKEDSSFTLNNKTLEELIKENPATFLGFTTTVDVLKCFDFKIVNLINMIENPAPFVAPIKLQVSPASFFQKNQEKIVRKTESAEILARREFLLPHLESWYAENKNQDRTFQLTATTLYSFMRSKPDIFPKAELGAIMPFFRDNIQFLKKEILRYRKEGKK